MTESLPRGWQLATLGELCTPRKGKSIPSACDQRPYLSLDNIAGDVGRIDGWECASDYRSQSVELSPGDVAYARLRPYLNKVAIADRAALGSAELIVLPPSWALIPAFLQYQLLSSKFVKFAQAESTGDRPRLKWNQMRHYTLAVPPIAEQERIVAAIEQHFSHLNAVETALSAAQSKADALLRAVVSEVCRGSWETVPLAEIITSLRNGVFVSRPAAEPPGLPIYRISAVRPLRLRIDDVRYARPESKGADDYTVNSGDVLFTRYSGNPSYVGAAAVVPDAGSGVLHPDKLIRVVVDRAQILPEWLAAYVSVGEGRRQVEMRLKTTAGQVGISGSQLKSVPVAVPPFDYQRSAVAKIVGVMADQKAIKLQLTTLRDKSSALRRSILACAFAGLSLP